jgi:SAM-dependent methyltransferase
MDERGPLAADTLPPHEIAALKELERRNRDLGAAEQGPGQFYDKAAFRLRAENRTYLHYLSPLAGETVLDAGAGLGRLALLVAPLAKRLVCLDLSAQALQVVEATADARGVRNIETVHADLCNLPRSLGPFDSAYAVEVVDHIPSHRERLAAVQTVHDLLRPGGRCLISVHCWNPRSRRGGVEKEGFWGSGPRRLYHYYFSAHELRNLLHQAGFRGIRLRGLIILPGRISRSLPTSLAVLETWCSMVPACARFGSLVIGMGTRPH